MAARYFFYRKMPHLRAAAFWVRFLVHKPAARKCVTSPHHKKKGTIMRAITHNKHIPVSKKSDDLIPDSKQK
jgi:hypothetical protein